MIINLNSGNSYRVKCGEKIYFLTSKNKQLELDYVGKVEIAPIYAKNKFLNFLAWVFYVIFALEIYSDGILPKSRETEPFDPRTKFTIYPNANTVVNINGRQDFDVVGTDDNAKVVSQVSKVNFYICITELALISLFILLLFPILSIKFRSVIMIALNVLDVLILLPISVFAIRSMLKKYRKCEEIWRNNYKG